MIKIEEILSRIQKFSLFLIDISIKIKYNFSSMKKIVDKIKSFGIIETIAFCVYVILILVIATHHEFYEDEAQSWLIARDLNLVEIVQQMKYEGHSFLWYYILAPFAKLGVPVAIQGYISCFFAIATAYIILKKSPFCKFTKVLLIFSSGMIYFYSILARSYCMIPFLLVCIATLYPNKKEHPYLYAILIALLANTHLIMLPTAGLLAVTFWAEELILKRKQQTEESTRKLCNSFLIAVIGIAIYGLIVIFTSENCEIIHNFDKTNSLKSMERFLNLLKNTALETANYFYGNINAPLYYKIMLGIVLVFCIIGSKNNLKQAILFWSQFLFTLLIHTLAWFILPTRVFITIYTLMFWLWAYKEDGQYQKKQKKNRWIEIALILLIIISMPSAYKLAFQDIKENFSTGKMTAEYIQENIPQGACFIYAEQELQQSIIACLEKDQYKFYMPNEKDFVTYTTWDKKWNTMIRLADVKETIENLKKEYKDLYLISGMSILPEANQEYNFELLFSTKDKLMDNFYVRKEIYNIYKINW